MSKEITPSELSSGHGVYLAVPKMLDLESIIDDNRKSYVDEYYYFISLILRKFAYDHSLDHNDVVELSHNYCIKWIDKRNLKIIKDDLLELGIIETDGSYQVGKKPYGYKLSDQYYLDALSLRLRLLQYPPLIKRINRHKNLQIIVNSKHEKRLFEMASSFSIDIEQALELANNCIESLLEQASKSQVGAPNSSCIEFSSEALNGMDCSRSSVSVSGKPASSPELIGNDNMNRSLNKQPNNILYKYTSTTTYHYDFQFKKMASLTGSSTTLSTSVLSELKKQHHRFQSALDIHQKHWFFKRDQNINRLHTNFTNTSSELRKLVSLQGCLTNLVEIDISNSQPLFLAAIVKRQFAVNQQLPSDVNKYVELCEAGNLYDHFISESVSRAFAKDNIIKYIFGKPGYENYNEVTKQFVKEFPTVTQFIKKTKSDDHKKTSNILQREESDFMIDQLCPLLLEKVPEINFYTVHDSIVAPEKYTDLIIHELRDGFKRKYGMKVGLKVLSL